MDKFYIIEAIQKEFNLKGIDFIIQSKTICHGRDWYDSPSKQYFYNTSCVGNINLIPNNYKLSINEHHDNKTGKLQKFSIDLIKGKKEFVSGYHLSSNQKSHIHKSKKGIKDKKHIFFTKDTKKIVNDIISKINNKKLITNQSS